MQPAEFHAELRTFGDWRGYSGVSCNIAQCRIASFHQIFDADDRSQLAISAVRRNKVVHHKSKRLSYVVRLGRFSLDVVVVQVVPRAYVLVHRSTSQYRTPTWSFDAQVTP